MIENSNGMREGRRSIALWSKLKPSASVANTQSIAPKMELHFNYWRMRSSETSDINKGERKPSGDFLDIGMMVSAASRIEGLYIYIPTRLTLADIVDLGGLFDDPSIVTGIFNERLTTKGSTGSQQTRDLAREPSEEFFCRVYRFVRSDGKTINGDEIKIEYIDSGTLLCITDSALRVASRNLDESKSIYFRIRILLPKEDNNCFARVITPADRWLLSGFDAAEYIDFRLNEARNLPELVEHRMIADGHDGKIPITRIDFLLVVRVAADFVGGHRAFHKSRLLEKELWASYVSSGTSAQVPEGMVIYHWKETSNEVIANNTQTDNLPTTTPRQPSQRSLWRLNNAPSGNPSPATAIAEGSTARTGGAAARGIDDFSAFVKLRLRRSGGSIVRRYLVILLVVGAIGGTVGNGLTYLVSKIPDMVGWSAATPNESKASTVCTPVSPTAADQSRPDGRLPPEGSGDASPAKDPKGG